MTGTYEVLIYLAVVLTINALLESVSTRSEFICVNFDTFALKVGGIYEGVINSSNHGELQSVMSANRAYACMRQI